MEEYSKQVSAWYNRVLETAFLTTHSDFVYVIRIFFIVLGLFCLAPACFLIAYDFCLWQWRTWMYWTNRHPVTQPAVGSVLEQEPSSHPSPSISEAPSDSRERKKRE